MSYDRHRLRNYHPPACTCAGCVETRRRRGQPKEQGPESGDEKPAGQSVWPPRSVKPDIRRQGGEGPVRGRAPGRDQPPQPGPTPVRNLSPRSPDPTRRGPARGSRQPTPPRPPGAYSGESRSQPRRRESSPWTALLWLLLVGVLAGAVVIALYFANPGMFAPEGDKDPIAVAAPPPTEETPMETPLPTPTPTSVPTPTLVPTATRRPTGTRGPASTPRPAFTPAPGSSAGALGDIDAGVVQDLVFRLLNEARQAAGVRSLKRDRSLDRMALEYSAVLAEAGTAKHGLTGESQFDRASDAGFRCSGSRSMAENNAKRPVASRWRGGTGGWSPMVFDRGAEGVAAGLVQQWMSSPPHRGNLLDPQYREVGIGVTVANEYAANMGITHPVVYAVASFAVCR